MSADRSTENQWVGTGLKEGKSTYGRETLQGTAKKTFQYLQSNEKNH